MKQYVLAFAAISSVAVLIYSAHPQDAEATCASGSGSGTGTGTATAELASYGGCDPAAALAACTADQTSCCISTFQPVAPITARPVIIPMDRCHQTPGTSKLAAPTATAAWCSDPVGLASVGGSSSDEGMWQVYGLVYRLMQNGIKVHWAINPSKEPPRLLQAQDLASQTYAATDIDFWALSSGATPPAPAGTLTACGAGCTPPVLRLSPSANWAPKTGSYTKRQFPVRGGAFVIAPEDRARFDNFIKRTGEFAGFATNALYNFSAVDMYELQTGATFAYQNFTTASPYTLTANALPIAQTLDFTPPRLARQSGSAVSTLWLSQAKLNDAAAAGCETGGAFSPTTAVYCDVSIAQMTSGNLVSGDFQWAWIDNFNDNSPCATPAEQGQIDQLLNFMTAVPGVRAGGSIMFMQAVIDVVEGCQGKQVMGKVGNVVGLKGDMQAPTESIILRHPGSLFTQWGDLPTNFASGSPGSWYYTTAAGSAGYDPAHTAAGTGTLTRFVTKDGGTLCSNHKSTPACDSFSSTSADNLDAYAYVRYLDNQDNGLAVYMGGNNVSQSANSAHLRAVLDAFLAVQVTVNNQEEPEADVREESRSAPIIATVDGTQAQYQGTFEVTEGNTVTTYVGAASDATFEFPFYKGHLRAYDTADISGTATEFDAINPLFDAGADDMIPTPNAAGCTQHFTGTCRTVFTTTAAPDADGLVSLPDRVFFNTTNTTSLQPLLSSSLTAAETRTLISRVLGGVKCAGAYEPALGGIDRSTMAIIEASPKIANNRPTMIYVGALDGMLHAICAEDKGACDQIGRELWAYIPKTQLGRLAQNTGRIDGSPKVADFYIDTTGGSAPSWHTILTFQTGSGSVLGQATSPAVITMDVSDPANPQVLWERVVPQTRVDVNLGTGLGVAMGPVRIAGVPRALVFAETNNGGTGSAGIYLAAYDLKDGAVVWDFEHEYPAPRISASGSVPTTGIPGGVAAYDAADNGFLTDVIVPTLYGDVWRLTASNGSNPFGTDPLFRFATDYHPIGAPVSLYREPGGGAVGVIFGDGGYIDPVEATWTTSSTTHYLIGITTNASLANVPLDEGSSTFGGERLFKQSLGTAGRVWASPLVAGGEVLVVTDAVDPNTTTYGDALGTGTLWRFLLETGAPLGTSNLVSAGGSGFDLVVVEGAAYIGSGSAAQRIDLNTSGGGGAFNTEGTSLELLSTANSTERMLWLSK